ncbi:MAG: alcohol dehydrogenase, partial [Planctomycetaceae bacterium]|nr:alcohol dehydrogenase [Planctomycetaceae bacterium]
AIQLRDIHGTFVLVGTVAPSPAISLDPEFLVRNLIQLVGVHNYRPDDLQAAISFLEESGSHFPFRELVEKSFALEDINEAVDFALREKPIRVMVRP